MKTRNLPFKLGDVADICGIIALALALGIGHWVLVPGAAFFAGLLLRPRLDSAAQPYLDALGIVLQRQRDSASFAMDKIDGKVDGSQGPPREESQMGKGNDSDRYVVPNKDRGGWDVVKEKHQRSSGHFDRKNEAVDRAREIVRNEGGGEIRISNKEGTRIDSDTVKGPKRGESPARDRK